VGVFVGVLVIWYSLSWIESWRIYEEKKQDFKVKTVMIGTDCIGSCKSNYHTITTMMSPLGNWDQRVHKSFL
jgi:hypothetical protein